MPLLCVCNSCYILPFRTLSHSVLTSFSVNVFPSRNEAMCSSILSMINGYCGRAQHPVQFGSWHKEIKRAKILRLEKREKRRTGR
jgi:hypothetical protein